MEFCEANPGKCYPFDPGIPTAGMTPRGPVEVNLPETGVTYGLLLTIALVLVLVGSGILLAVKKFK